MWPFSNVKQIKIFFGDKGVVIRNNLIERVLEPGVHSCKRGSKIITVYMKPFVIEFKNQEIYSHNGIKLNCDIIVEGEIIDPTLIIHAPISQGLSESLESDIGSKPSEFLLLGGVLAGLITYNSIGVAKIKRIIARSVITLTQKVVLNLSETETRSSSNQRKILSNLNEKILPDLKEKTKRWGIDISDIYVTKTTPSKRFSKAQEDSAIRMLKQEELSGLFCTMVNEACKFAEKATGQSKGSEFERAFTHYVKKSQHYNHIEKVMENVGASTNPLVWVDLVSLLKITSD